MAKTLFGALIVDMRNKLGGHVLSKNRAGSFIRRKVSPSQPNTGAQALIRGIMSSMSRAWSGVLDNTERAAWVAFAALHPVTDQFGQNVILTGQQMFNRLNNVINFLGGTTIESPPASLAVAAITAFTPLAAEGAGTFTLDDVLPATVGANERYVVWATKGVSLGKDSIDSLYSYVAKFSALTTGDLNIASAYIAKYGVLDAGTKVGVGIRVQNIVTGASSPLLNKIITVAA